MSSILFEKKRIDVNSMQVRLAAILISICTTMYFINMPLMLGLAINDLSLTQSSVWLLGGVFLGGAVLASILSIFFIRIANWPRLIVISGLMSLLAFLLPVFITGLTVLLSSLAVAGFFAGISYAVVIACLGDTANPTRNYALVLTAQTAMVVLSSYFLPQLFMRETTFKEVLIVVAGLSFISIFLSRIIPRNGRRISLKSTITAQSPLIIFIALFALLLIFVGGNVVRNTIEPIASRFDFSVTSGGGMMMILVLSSGLGSLIAALICTRSSYAQPIAIALGIAVIILVMGLFGVLPDRGLILGFCLVGGAWNFASAYGMGLIARLDSGGRYTPLIATVQMIGSVAGITIVGTLAVGGNYVLPYMLTCIAWVLALIIVILIVRLNRERLSAKGSE